MKCKSEDGSIPSESTDGRDKRRCRPKPVHSDRLRFQAERGMGQMLRSALSTARNK